MFNRKHAGPSAIGFTALLAVLTACGTGSTPATAVSGTAVADGAVTGTVTLVDASSPAQQRTVSTDGGGAFIFDTKGTQAPYLLKVAGSDHAGAVTLYGVSDGQQSLDVNPLTDAAYAAAAGEKSSDQAFRDGTSDGRTRVSGGTITLLNQLKTVLAPLLERYGIVDPFKDTAKVRLLLADVAFKSSDGTLTVTNRATGGVIYSAPLRKITTGTFHPENMPSGPCATATATAGGDGAALYAASCQSCHGALASSRVKGATVGDIQEAIKEQGKMSGLSGLTSAQLTAIASALAGATTTCGGTACTYAYGEWTACAGGTQTRGVTSATPDGCTGTPVVTQTCTSTPPPGACTSYAYSAWGACSNGTQTRTVTSASPAGCTDQTTTPPVLTQSCSVAVDGAALFASTCQKCHGPIAGVANGSPKITVPTSATAISGAGMTQGLSSAQVTAVAAAINAAAAGTPTCTGYNYGAWGTCSAAGTQTRAVTSTIPATCDQAGNPPVLSQGCTPTAVACTGYTYATWGACSAAGQQTRTVVSAIPAGCDQTVSPPVLSQSCTPACTSYSYGAWGTCSAAGQQSRAVTATVPATCDQTSNPPVLSQSCTPTPAACTGFSYSAWGTCSAAGQQTRTVASYTPAGCSGTPSATPVLSQSCTPPVVACTSYTYTAWGTCSAAGLQTRAVTVAAPSGCTNQTTTPPVLTQSCTPPVTCTLATAVPTCSSCHGGGTVNKAAPSSHSDGRSPACATCHTSITATATPSSTGACVLNYPTNTGTHGNGTVNF